MDDQIEDNKYNRISYESFVLGILALFSSVVFFLLVPGKPIGFNLIEIIDPRNAFNKYVFFLFLTLLIGALAAGSSIVSIIFGIKDFKGVFRGAHIRKGQAIYLAGAAAGSLSIILLLGFFVFFYLI